MSVLTEGKSSVEPSSLAQISGLRRFGSNRARLALLLLKGRLILSSWRFSHCRAAPLPFLWNSDLFATLLLIIHSSLDFDATLGYPGEGPLAFRHPGLVLLLAVLAFISTLAGRFLRASLVFRFGVNAMDAGVCPRDAKDRARAGDRAGVSLEAGGFLEDEKGAR